MPPGLTTATFYYWSFGGLKRSGVYSNDPIERIGPDDTWRFSSQRTRPRNASAFMHRNNDRASRGLTDRSDLEVEPWPAQKVALDLGQGSTNAEVVSDNKIQLKFKTKEFEGEFFPYTGDLFLIHKSGHLTRMRCQKAQG